MASDPEQELSDKVERLYVEYAAARGPAPARPPGFPTLDVDSDNNAERERLTEAERQVIEHVAWHGRLPEELTDEQRWLLEWWIERRPLIEDAVMRLTFQSERALRRAYVGEAIERELEALESARARGRKRTYHRAIQALTDELVRKHPGDSVEKLWRRACATYFRTAQKDAAFNWGDRFEVYCGRDPEGENVLIQVEQVDSRVSRETPLRRRSFRPYVERAGGKRPRR